VFKQTYTNIRTKCAVKSPHGNRRWTPVLLLT